MTSVFSPELYIFEADTDKQLEVPMTYGPRAVARALGATFGPEWDYRHVATCAFLICDFTAGERDVFGELIHELSRADLKVVRLV